MVGAQRFVILDRDGVINHDSVAYIKSPAEWQPLEGSLKAIAALTEAGFLVAVITNQSGVGRGLLSEAMLQRIHTKMRSAAEAAGGQMVVTADPGCLLQMRGMAAPDQRVEHVATVLAARAADLKLGAEASG